VHKSHSGAEIAPPQFRRLANLLPKLRVSGGDMRSQVAAQVLFGRIRHESATANDSDIAALNSSIDEIDPPIAPSRIDAGQRVDGVRRSRAVKARGTRAEE
jgi:hypothetical protein